MSSDTSCCLISLSSSTEIPRTVLTITPLPSSYLLPLPSLRPSVPLAVPSRSPLTLLQVLSTSPLFVLCAYDTVSSCTWRSLSECLPLSVSDPVVESTHGVFAPLTAPNGVVTQSLTGLLCLHTGRVRCYTRVTPPCHLQASPPDPK